MSYLSRSPSIESQNINKKRKRISQESEELAWTVARCNRLLRSITQRVGVLRKLVANDFTGDVPKPRKSLEKRVASHWSTQDPVWIGDAKRKTGAKTFAGRKKANKQQVAPESPKTDLIHFPSPFVRRIGLREKHLDIASPTVGFVRPALPAPKQTKQLPIKPGNPRIEAERGLVSAFGSLLGVTKGKAPPISRGARSLMSTCLRNVPQYIAINEADEEDDESNVTSEVMSYLEDFGTRENGGWSGLREVVRTQAMYAVCEAIEDDVLSDNLIRELVNLCGSHNSISEGQELLLAWFEAGEAVTAKQIDALNAFGKEQRCESSNFGIVRLIGENSSTNLASFCKTPRFWNDLLRILVGSEGHEAANVLSLLAQHCLRQGLGCSEGLGLGIKETMLGLTTMAASATLLNDSLVQHEGMSNIVHQLAADAIFTEHHLQSRELHQTLVNCSLLLLGLSSDPCGVLNAAEMSTTGSLARIPRSDFATEIYSTISALEQHLHSDLTEILIERMVDQASIAPLYRQIAVAAITAKRQSSESEEDDVLYADYINRIAMQTSSGPTKTPRTPFRETPKARFRWEDGICEWVAKTPFTAAAMGPPTPASISVAEPKFDDKENQPTLPETSCAFVKTKACLLQYSPDVLAVTPRITRKQVAGSPIEERRAKRTRFPKQVAASVKQGGRRRTSRLSSRPQTEDESADELGF